MAHKMQREQWARSGDDHRTDFDRAKSPLPLRVASLVLWVLSACLQVGTVAVVAGRLAVPVLSDVPALAGVLGAAACLALTVVAQGLWKKAGSLRACKGQAQAGVFMACLGFVGWVVFFLPSRNLSPAAKGLGVLGAALAVGACVAVCLVP